MDLDKVICLDRTSYDNLAQGTPIHSAPISADDICVVSYMSDYSRVLSEGL